MEDEETEYRSPTRVNISDYIAAGYIFLTGIAGAFHNLFETLALVHVVDSQAISEQQEFKRTAGRDIEALPTTDTPRGE